MLKWNRKRKGFTLVELVIVIAILGVLAMYALPKYEGIIKEARSSEARAQLGSFRSALGIYYAKNHGQFPAYTTVALNGIFADERVPEVEITYKKGTVKGTVVRDNKIKGGSTVPIKSASISTDPSTDGCWVYAVKSDNTESDVRLNSTDEDSAHPGHYWYEY